jgi:hypothetical protein
MRPHSCNGVSEDTIQLDNPLGNEGSIFRYGIEHSSLVVGIGRSRA